MAAAPVPDFHILDTIIDPSLKGSDFFVWMMMRGITDAFPQSPSEIDRLHFRGFLEAVTKMDVPVSQFLHSDLKSFPLQDATGDSLSADFWARENRWRVSLGKPEISFEISTIVQKMYRRLSWGKILNTLIRHGVIGRLTALRTQYLSIPPGQQPPAQPCWALNILNGYVSMNDTQPFDHQRFAALLATPSHYRDPEAKGAFCATWNSLHFFANSSNPDLSPDQFVVWKDLEHHLSWILPCESCNVNYRMEQKTHPLTQVNISRQMVDRHNNVSQRIGKDVLCFADAQLLQFVFSGIRWELVFDYFLYQISIRGQQHPEIMGMGETMNALREISSVLGIPKLGEQDNGSYASRFISSSQ